MQFFFHDLLTISASLHNTFSWWLQIAIQEYGSHLCHESKSPMSSARESASTARGWISSRQRVSFWESSDDTDDWFLPILPSNTNQIMQFIHNLDSLFFQTKWHNSHKLCLVYEWEWDSLIQNYQVDKMICVQRRDHLHDHHHNASSSSSSSSDVNSARDHVQKELVKVTIGCSGDTSAVTSSSSCNSLTSSSSQVISDPRE